MNTKLLYEIYKREGIAGAEAFCHKKSQKGPIPQAILRQAFALSCENNNMDLMLFLKPMVSFGLQKTGAAVLLSKGHMTYQQCCNLFWGDVFSNQEKLLVEMICKQNRESDVGFLLGDMKTIHPQTIISMLTHKYDEKFLGILEKAFDKVNWERGLSKDGIQYLLQETSDEVFHKTLKALSCAKWIATRKRDMAKLCFDMQNNPERLKHVVCLTDEDHLNQVLPGIRAEALGRSWGIRGNASDRLQFMEREGAKWEVVFNLFRRRQLHQVLFDNTSDQPDNNNTHASSRIKKRM